MDPQSNRCLGCARTLDEIARWASMTDQERNQILSELPDRKSNVAKVAVPPLA